MPTGYRGEVPYQAAVGWTAGISSGILPVCGPFPSQSLPSRQTSSACFCEHCRQQWPLVGHGVGERFGGEWALSHPRTVCVCVCVYVCRKVCSRCA